MGWGRGIATGLANVVGDYGEEKQKQKRAKALMSALESGGDIDYSNMDNPEDILTAIKIQEALREGKQKAEESKLQRGLYRKAGLLDEEPSMTGTETKTIPSAKLKGFKVGGLDFEMPQTQEERDIEIQQTGQKEAELERIKNLGKVKRLEPIISNIESEWKATKPHTGVTGGALGTFDLIKSFSPVKFTQDMRQDTAYRQYVQGMRAQLARAMGDVGNLSEPEQKAAMNLVPSLMDDKQTGEIKIQQVRSFIKALERNPDEARNYLKNMMGVSKQPIEQGNELIINSVEQVR